MDVYLEVYGVHPAIPSSGITSIRIQNGFLLVDDYEYSMEDIKELRIVDDDNSTMCAECTEVSDCDNCEQCYMCERICDDQKCPNRVEGEE